MKKWLRISLLILLLTLAAGCLFFSGTGNISGRVTDVNSYPIEGVTITTNPYTETTTTDSNGNYILVDIKAGDYTITATKDSITVSKEAVLEGPGFFGFTVKDIVVNIQLIENGNGNGNGPTTPTLVSPGNNTTIGDLTPDFDWTDSTSSNGIANYQIMVDNSSSFTSPEIDQYPTSSDYTPGSSLSNDTYYWKVRAKDNLGTWGSWTTAWAFTIDIDTQAPTGGSIEINSGASYTNSTSVTLTLYASGASNMKFKNDSGAWGVYESYSTSKSRPINSGDGNRYVYVIYKNLAGNESSSVSDYIYLDTTAPSIPSGLSTETISMDDIRLDWNASNDSGIGVSGYKIYRNSSYIGYTSGGTSYTDSNLPAYNTSYSYQVLAYDGYNQESSKCSSVIGDTGSYIEISSTKDSHINSASPTTNYGSESIMFVGPQQGTSDLMTFVYFPLPGDLTSDKTIYAAKIRTYLFVEKTCSVSAYRINSGSWSESSITWNSSPSWDSANPYSGGNGSIPINNHWFDVKPAINMFKSGTSNYGFAIWSSPFGQPTNEYHSYYSKEGSYAPVLQIWYY